MREYKSEDLRNIVLAGHSRAGKTSLAEACLFNAGATTRLGKVDDGTAVMDSGAEEKKRKLSVNLSLGACEWKGTKINLLDAPGYPDFAGDMVSGCAAADAMLICVSGKSGVAQGTDAAWKLAKENNLPRAFFITKIDRENVDFYKVMDELTAKYGQNVVALDFPMGTGPDLKGVCDVLRKRERLDADLQDVPADFADDVEMAHAQLVEAVAEYDDGLMEKFLADEPYEEVDVLHALREGIRQGKVFPVFCGAPTNNVGVKDLLDNLVEYMPSPAGRTVMGTDKNDEPVERKITDPFSAQVFKTVVDPFVGRLSYIRIYSGDLKGDTMLYNVTKGKDERLSAIFTMQGKEQITLPVAHAGDIVVAAKLVGTSTGDTFAAKNAQITYPPLAFPVPMLMMAVQAQKKGEEDKVFGSLGKQVEEDPSLKIEKQEETRETVIRGIGEVHLDVVKDMLQRKFGAAMKLVTPRTPYRETIKKTVEAEGKHKKQSGGHGQYGHVFIEMSPKPAGTGNEFTETIFGGSVPRQFIPAVEKGVAETLAGGILAGYPVVDVKVNLKDGSYHSVDSSEAAFKAAAALAIKKAAQTARPVLLEPILEVKVVAPESYMGDIIGKINSKRGQILGMDSAGDGMREVSARVPQAEMYGFATELRSMTQAYGSYTQSFADYAEVPERDTAAIIEAAAKEREAKAKDK